EDGIRDFHVTGVQTCALPIYSQSPVSSLLLRSSPSMRLPDRYRPQKEWSAVRRQIFDRQSLLLPPCLHGSPYAPAWVDQQYRQRSEERRVGKECSCRWSKSL